MHEGRNNVDSLYREMIRLLQADGRTSNVEIARILGVAESTVRKRLERLLAEGSLRISAWPRLADVGLPVQVLLWLQVPPVRLKEVLDCLERLPEVCTLRVTSGEYQVQAELCFAADEDLRSFVDGRLGTLPGITRMATAQVLHTRKHMADWRLPGRKPPVILVVDDDPDFVETTRLVLQSRGYRVDDAASGGQALERMRSTLPDLVLLDVMMDSVLDGVAVSAAMREDRTMAAVPLLMVSSTPTSPYAQLFPTERRLHVDGFLTKPVGPEQLLREVERLLQRGPRCAGRLPEGGDPAR
ncbi:MAG: response regulator [Chloroflexi bacterium]|nr:response regulator [Chloroflexota bacterium]